MQVREMQKIIDGDVSYRDWDIMVVDGWDGVPYLQVAFMADGALQKGRKWRLSEYMSKSELIQTALKAVLTAEEHEAREKFTYRGRAVFGPHIDVDVLWEVNDRVDLREPV